MMSYSQEKKGETTDEVCQEQCFLKESLASLSVDFDLFNHIYIYTYTYIYIYIYIAITVYLILNFMVDS